MMAFISLKASPHFKSTRGTGINCGCGYDLSVNGYYPIVRVSDVTFTGMTWLFVQCGCICTPFLKEHTFFIPKGKNRVVVTCSDCKEIMIRVIGVQTGEWDIEVDESYL